MARHDFLRGTMQVAGACVVAKAFPRLGDATRMGARDIGKGGELTEEFTVLGDHSRDLRLLEHQLRHEDAIRIARFSPGQVTSVLPIPCAQPASEGSVSRGLLFATPARGAL